MIKTIFCLFGFAALVYGAAVPATLQDGQDWALEPDDKGVMRVVHLTEEFPDPAFERFTPETDIIFELFTRQNPESGDRIIYNQPQTVLNSRWSAARPLRLVIHGWLGGNDSNINAGARRAFLAAGDFNVISVDWSAGAGTLNYATARGRVDGAGAVVGRLINMFVSLGQPLRSIYIIGHSLGGQMAGVSGKNVNGLVDTVYALDPAGPLFRYEEVHRRVAIGDAHYVEVIQTNANVLGFGQPLGDVDFYPNGGNSQPGCGIDLTGDCAHARAHEFYIESIANNNFWGRQCGTRAQPNASGTGCTGALATMGGEPSNSATQPRGAFWLQTRNAAPFALGPW